MNPFTTPDRIFVSPRPQDMRAGIQRLAGTVAAEFGRDPMDGALCVFVSRDCEKVKMLRFETSGWRMCYVRLLEGGFRWNRSGDPSAPLLTAERGQLPWLPEGLDVRQPKVPKPVAAHGFPWPIAPGGRPFYGIIYACGKRTA